MPVRCCKILTPPTFRWTRNGGISKKIIDLTDIATASALFGLAMLLAPAEVVGVGGVVLISFTVSCIGYWAVPNISYYLVRSAK